MEAGDAQDIEQEQLLEQPPQKRPAVGPWAKRTALLVALGVALIGAVAVFGSSSRPAEPVANSHSLKLTAPESLNAFIQDYVAERGEAPLTESQVNAIKESLSNLNLQRTSLQLANSSLTRGLDLRSLHGRRRRRGDDDDDDDCDDDDEDDDDDDDDDDENEDCSDDEDSKCPCGKGGSRRRRRSKGDDDCGGSSGGGKGKGKGNGKGKGKGGVSKKCRKALRKSVKKSLGDMAHLAVDHFLDCVFGSEDSEECRKTEERIDAFEKRMKRQCRRSGDLCTVVETHYAESSKKVQTTESFCMPKACHDELDVAIDLVTKLLRKEESKNAEEEDHSADHNKGYDIKFTC